MTSFIYILGVDSKVIIDTLSRDPIDFEDGIQITVAELNEMDAIVTRNHKDFRDSKVSVYSPPDFLKM
ncbi:hypothetical protein [Nonlabens spongiae]|uniref:hypothetical protein n=1 Tax=Nonlabens spongiae TaxID=331648 RepID=UPI000A26ABB3|nr:hypothetical protein [Nonlabens spongiae]